MIKGQNDYLKFSPMRYMFYARLYHVRHQFIISLLCVYSLTLFMNDERCVYSDCRFRHYVSVVLAYDVECCTLCTHILVGKCEDG